MQTDFTEWAKTARVGDKFDAPLGVTYVVLLRGSQAMMLSLQVDGVEQTRLQHAVALSSHPLPPKPRPEYPYPDGTK